MAARSIGSGTISFGLVAIPVKLFSTVDTTKAVRFNYLSQDGSRLKQQYIRASDGEVIEREDRVQGYEFAKGQYVLFSEDEIKAMHVDATNAIDIAEFIPLEDVERLYIEKVYYLGPDKGAARSYHLLRAALQETGRAALANYAARGRQNRDPQTVANLWNVFCSHVPTLPRPRNPPDTLNRVSLAPPTQLEVNRALDRILGLRDTINITLFAQYFS